MSSDLFDVFVVGAADGSAAGRERLAAALAGKNANAAPSIAKAIADRSLRAGHGLSKAQADATADRLRATGAHVELRPSGAVGAAAAHQPSAPVGGPPSLGELKIPEALKGLGALQLKGGGEGAAPGRRASPQARGTMLGIGSPFASMPGSSAPPPSPATTGQFSSFGGPGADTGARVGPPTAPRIGVPADVPALPQRLSPVNGAPAFIPDAPGTPTFAPPPDGAEIPLELDHSQNNKPKVRPSAAWGTASGRTPVSVSALPTPTVMNVEMGEEGSSNNVFVVRCPKHDLAFDRRKASGCRQCLAPARNLAARIEEATSERSLGAFAGSPQKRAFLGLAFALVIGFLPAVYHALRIANDQVKDMRATQEELSRRPGTQAVLDEFDHLDKKVEEARTANLLKTGLVWFAVSTGALIGWYRMT